MLKQLFNALGARMTKEAERTNEQRTVLAFRDMAQEVNFLNLQSRGHSGDINNPVMRELRKQLAEKGWRMGDAEKGVETELSHAVRIFTLKSESFIGSAGLDDAMEKFAEGGPNLRGAVDFIRNNVGELEGAVAATKWAFFQEHMKIVTDINRAMAYAPRRPF